MDIKVNFAVVVDFFFLVVVNLHRNDAFAPAHAIVDVALVVAAAAAAAAACVVAVLVIFHNLWNGESMMMIMMLQM